MTMRFIILPILALSTLAAFSPAQASQAGDGSSILAARSGEPRLEGKGDKPRRPAPKPGPRGGGTDGEDG